MDLNLFFHLIFLSVLNIIFCFSGVVFNTLVIITILKSTQLRKKLCHFMIMMLSCCDLLTVLIYGSAYILYFIAWFTKNDLHATVIIYRYFSNFLAGLSLLTLMVMCIERYLGVYYPFFHKTSVTRRRLLTLLAIFAIPLTVLITSTSTNDSLISRAVAYSIFMVIYVPPFVFFNYKLFKMSRKIHRQNAISPELRRRISLKHINTCLLAVACLVFSSIPISVYVTLVVIEGSMSDNVIVSELWATTTTVMNCSFNSLIFFWKNKLLRDEGIKIIKKIKDRVLRS